MLLELIEQYGLPTAGAVILILLIIRYVVFSGSAWLFIWKILGRRLEPFRIQAKLPGSRSIQNEIKYSLLTLAIFALVGLALLLARQSGYTLVYTDIHQYGGGYLVLSFFLLVVLHDTYFYWMHRLMHHRLLYRFMHSVHHRSTNPSPWASFSFHPAEAVVEAGILPLAVFIMPLHPVVIAAFILFMNAFNVLGHLGYELFGRWFSRTPLRYVLNTSFHHNMHHRKFSCNYGLYFNWWDRLMGTNHKHYDDSVKDFIESRRPLRVSLARKGAAEI